MKKTIKTWVWIISLVLIILLIGNYYFTFFGLLNGAEKLPIKGADGNYIWVFTSILSGTECGQPALEMNMMGYRVWRTGTVESNIINVAKEDVTIYSNFGGGFEGKRPDFENDEIFTNLQGSSVSELASKKSIVTINSITQNPENLRVVNVEITATKPYFVKFVAWGESLDNNNINDPLRYVNLMRNEDIPQGTSTYTFTLPSDWNKAHFGIVPAYSIEELFLRETNPSTMRCNLDYKGFAKVGEIAEKDLNLIALPPPCTLTCGPNEYLDEKECVCKLIPSNCGNGVCDSGEDNTNCPDDCTSPTPTPSINTDVLLIVGVIGGFVLIGYFILRKRRFKRI